MNGRSGASSSSIALWAVLAGAAASGCADSPSPSPSSTRDSAGITIVDVSAAELTALPEWHLGEPEVVLGSPGAGPAHQFSHIVDGFRLVDGSILVGDEQTRELRVFAANGEAERTFGGQGQGPGEVPHLHRVERGRGDTILVSAWPFGMLSVFRADGAYLESRTIGPFWPGLTRRVLPDGSLLLGYFDRGYGNNVELWGAEGEERTFQARGALVRAWEGGRVDTLRAVVGERFFKTGVWRRDLWLAPLPYASATLTALSRDRVFVGERDRAEVEVRDLDGTLEMLIRWTGDPVRVEGADRDRFAAAALERLRQPQRAPHVRRWLAAVPFPELKPPLLALHADRAGALWVQVPSAAQEHDDAWIVFHREGMPLARVRPPRDARLLDVGDDYALVVRSDELDVERVELRPLTRS